MSILKNNALLINLKISQWTGRKFDKRATESVELNHKTAGQVGNFNKRLLPGAKELETVGQVTGQIRKFYYERTLPWASDGARIIKSDAYLEFMNDFAKFKTQFESAVKSFLAAYPSLQAEAQTRLGDLYNAADYPELWRLENAFRCEAVVLPIPDVSDFRVEISEQDRKTLEDTIKQAEAEAMRDVWERLYNVISKAADKLSEPDAIFRNSLLGNITELCELLPKLNVTNDQSLSDLGNDLHRVVDSVSTADVRKDSTTREATAKQLKSIQDRMGAFMGAQDDK